MSNGEHAEARRRRSQEVGKRTRAQRAPLRRITERQLVDGHLVETLECGDVQEPRVPLFGGVGPEKRRCLKCLERLEAEAEAERREG